MGQVDAISPEQKVQQAVVNNNETADKTKQTEPENKQSIFTEIKTYSKKETEKAVALFETAKAKTKKEAAEFYRYAVDTKNNMNEGMQNSLIIGSSAFGISVISQLAKSFINNKVAGKILKGTGIAGLVVTIGSLAAYSIYSTKNTNEKVKQHSNEKTKLTSELDEANKGKEKLSAELQEANQKNETLKGELDESKTENESLTLQLDEANQENDELSALLDKTTIAKEESEYELNEKLIQSENQIKKLEADIEELQKKNEALKNTNHSLIKKNVEEIQKHFEQIERLKLRNNILKKMHIIK